jgi:hypothetical protein
MKRWSFAILLVSTVNIFGCLVIPYPHKVVPHSYITGRVIDFETQQPISGAQIYLHWAGARTETDENGQFEFVPGEERRFLVRIPLLPWEFWWLCGDTLVVDSPRSVGLLRYRRETREVKSCPVPYWWAHSRRENFDIHENLGDIPLGRISTESSQR